MDVVRLLDLIVDDVARSGPLSRISAEGFEKLFDSEAFTDLLHADPGLGRLDLVWVEGETSRRLFTASPSSGIVSAPEPLPAEAFVVSSEVAEALERNRPGPMSLEEYARFVKSFRWSTGQLRAIPTSEGLPRFTLDG